MPRMEQTVEETVGPELDTPLTPLVQQSLRQACREYQMLDAQIKVLEAKRDVKKAQLGAIRDEAGVMSLLFEGFKVTLVGGVRKVQNVKKLIALGCKKEWLEEATDLKPSKPYEKISLPGAKERPYRGDSETDE